MDDSTANRIKTGQLVRFNGKPTRPHINIWRGPAVVKKDEDPIYSVNLNDIGLILEVYMTSSKIFVDGVVGWVENWDIDPL